MLRGLARTATLVAMTYTVGDARGYSAKFFHDPIAARGVYDSKHERIEYYDITGRTREELAHSFRERGPRDDGGGLNFARYSWRVHWNWESSDQSGAPALELESTLVFPRWVDERHASPELRRWFGGIVERMADHELNHRGLVRDHFERLELRIADVAVSDPTASHQRFETLVREEIRNLRLANERYDRETSHGRNEGIPPLTPDGERFVPE